MTQHQEFRFLLRQLQCTNRFTQCTALKDISAALQEANISDLQELLELLISTHDTDIQTKLFSVLAAHIINNGVNYEVIVKYNPLYDTIQTLLARGLQTKAAVVLNFVTALLSGSGGGGGDARSLAAHARNMIRVSGCLNTMADIFCGSMMYQDTWIALCQSLAEACHGSEINQNYSSHLVPLCVQRCRQGNVYVCAVLQSLLDNHERNLQVFIESDGSNIFTRQLLQYNMGMQLLNTVVEKSSMAVSILRTTNVVFHLRDFLHLYGPHSQMGQWSTIILYHLDKGETSQRPPIENMRTENPSKVISHQENLGKQTDDVMEVDNKPMEQRSKVEQINRKANFQTEPIFKNDNNHTSKQDDTASLFQNVIKEVLYWKSKEKNNTDRQINFDLAKTAAFDHRDIPRQFVTRPQNSYRSNTKQNNRENTYENDLTFSFQVKKTEKNNTDRQINFDLAKTAAFDHCDIPRQFVTRPQNSYRSNTKQNNRENTYENDVTFSFQIKKTMQDSPKHYSVLRNDKITESFLTPGNTRTNVTSYDKEVQTNNSILENTGFYNKTKIDMKNFRPPFISTPKRNKTSRTNMSKITYRNRESTTYSRKQMKKLNRPKCSDYSKQEISSANREVKHRSMSERFFSAINESCTTIVKSVKSIFRQKQDKDEKNSITTKATDNVENESCSYSFTNYMHKRDTLLEGEFSHRDSTSSGNYKTDSCKTCRDTIVLQQKMKRNDNLKQTVRKLKMGINLYGCDFKKISHAMWPRDRYMTPEMLYNLYRKLIVKGGHENHSFRLRQTYNALNKRQMFC